MEKLLTDFLSAVFLVIAKKIGMDKGRAKPAAMSCICSVLLQ